MRLLAIPLALLLLACEGPMGPEGPPGPAGPVNRFVATAIANSAGDASVLLPTAAGAVPSQPPGLDCFLSTSTSSGVWLNVTDGDFDTLPYCGLVLQAGRWQAQLNNAPAGWAALFIATW